MVMNLRLFSRIGSSEGRIEDFGTYEELCESSELFSNLRTESEKDEDQAEEPSPRSYYMSYIQYFAAIKKKKGKAVMFEPPALPEESKADQVKQGRVCCSSLVYYGLDTFVCLHYLYQSFLNSLGSYFYSTPSWKKCISGTRFQ